MTYCYTPIDSPEFFSGAGGCETVGHDLRVKAGGLAASYDLTSAALIQLGTDARANDAGGWWGDEFQPFPIGNTLWALAGQPASTTSIGSKVDEQVRKAIGPLIRQGLVDELTVKTVRTITGAEVSLDLKRGNQTILEAQLNG